MAADFLAIGHVVKDVNPGGWRLGGGVAYASLQAHRLGYSTAAVTACSPDISPAEHIPHTHWHVLPGEQSTTFENVYLPGRRSQRVIDQARPITSGQIPASWRSAPLVLLAPVIGDVDPEAASVFPETSLVGIGAQGWLRRLEGSDVRPGRAEPLHPWLVGDIVFVSAEDVTNPEDVASWLTYVPMVVLTRGRDGFTVFDDDGAHDFAAEPAAESDPTGAGDVFATAFLIRWHETHDLDATARFAAAAAALVVERPGLDGVAGRDRIEARLAAGAVGEGR